MSPVWFLLISVISNINCDKVNVVNESSNADRNSSESHKYDYSFPVQTTRINTTIKEQNNDDNYHNDYDDDDEDYEDDENFEYDGKAKHDVDDEYDEYFKHDGNFEYNGEAEYDIDDVDDEYDEDEDEIDEYFKHDKKTEITLLTLLTTQTSTTTSLPLLPPDGSGSGEIEGESGSGAIDDVIKKENFMTYLEFLKLTNVALDTLQTFDRLSESVSGSGSGSGDCSETEVDGTLIDDEDWCRNFRNRRLKPLTPTSTSPPFDTSGEDGSGSGSGDDGSGSDNGSGSDDGSGRTDGSGSTDESGGVDGPEELLLPVSSSSSIKADHDFEFIDLTIDAQ